MSKREYQGISYEGYKISTVDFSTYKSGEFLILGCNLFTISLFKVININFEIVLFIKVDGRVLTLNEFQSSYGSDLLIGQISESF